GGAVGPQCGVLRLQLGDAQEGLVGLEAPRRTALGQRGELILEPLDGGFEIVVLFLPAIPAFSEEPHQGTTPAGELLLRRVPRGVRGSIHALLLGPRPRKSSAPVAQQNKSDRTRRARRIKTNFPPAQGYSLGHPPNEDADSIVLVPLSSTDALFRSPIRQKSLEIS